MDPRGLCPQDWRVCSDEDWLDLELSLGMNESDLFVLGFRGTDQGEQIKSSPTDLPYWNGTNSTGFSATPGGMRHSNGTFQWESMDAYFWTTTYYEEEGDYPNVIFNFDEGAWVRFLYTNISGIARQPWPMNSGFSVRCLKND